MTDKIEKMTDDDFKKIMQQLGMPESMSLYAALKQVENHTWQACAARTVPVHDGNYADGELYKILDALYHRGWVDLHKGRDYDPRGTVEWQAVLDMFVAQSSKTSPETPNAGI